MPIQTTILAPGEGQDFDFTVTNPGGALLDVSTWTVTGKLLAVPAGTEIAVLTVSGVDANTWRAKVTGAQTTTLAGQKAMIKVIGVDPANPNCPVVQERLLLIGSL